MRDGVLFVATGAGYRQLAARAAASVARVSPGLPIDLATDEPVEPGDFATVTLLDDPWFRSRIDAMAATRFERTLHLDADVLAVADLRDVFEVLDRFDIALAHDQARNSPAANAVWRRPLPAAFPQFNGGVIAYRRTPEVLGFLGRWAEAMRAPGMRKDQPSLRELLWESDLRIATLPPEYNLLDLGAVRRWDRFRPAPRLIHHYRFHKHFTGRRREVASVEDLLGPMTAARLPMMLAADRGLRPHGGARAARADPRRPRRRLRRRPRRPAALGRDPRRLRPEAPRPMTEPRVLTCADAGYFHFLPFFEANVERKFGTLPLIYDLGLTDAQRASLRSEVRRVAVPEDFAGTAHGFIRATHKPACVADALDAQPRRRALRRRRPALRRAGDPAPTSATPTWRSRPEPPASGGPTISRKARSMPASSTSPAPRPPGPSSRPGPRPARSVTAATRRRSLTYSPSSTCSARSAPPPAAA